MPASQPVDYVVMLKEIVEHYDRLPGWIEDEGARLDANERAYFARAMDAAESLADHLAALRAIRRGCKEHCGGFRCGDRRGLDRSVYLCGPCSIKSNEIQYRLTHTNPRDAHGR